MYAEVIPFTKLPADKSTFTYQVPAEMQGSISIGSFVQFSFRNKTQFGVVKDLHEKKPSFKRILSISDTLEESPSWSSASITALWLFAKESYVSPATLAKAFSPAIPKKTTKTRTRPQETISPPVITKEDLSLKINSNHQSFIFSSLSEKISLIKEAGAINGSCLIMTPSMLDAQEISILLHDLLSSTHEIIVWDPKASKNKQWNTWNLIKSAKNAIVISTRSGLFLPLQNLGCVILDQSDRADHKSWEASPHYDIRIGASLLTEQLSIPLISLSRSPRITNTATKQTLSPPAPVTSLLHDKSNPLLHPDIQDLVKSSSDQGRTIIVSNSSAQTNTLHCIDCHHQWECPEYHGTLTMKSNALSCSQCGYSLPLPNACTECSGQRIKAYGYGIQGIYADLKKHHPELDVEYLDSEKLSSSSTADFAATQIFVLTPFMLKRFYYALTNLSGSIRNIVYVHPESLLFLPDYRANEKLYKSIQWHRSIAHDYFSAELIIQSKLDRTNALWDRVISANWNVYAQEELQTRKKHKNPPFSRQISLIYKYTGKDDKTSLNEISKHLKGSGFMHSLPRTSWKNQKPYSVIWTIVQENPEQRKTLDKMLESLYSRVIIDVNSERFS